MFIKLETDIFLDLENPDVSVALQKEQKHCILMSQKANRTNRLNFCAPSADDSFF